METSLQDTYESCTTPANGIISPVLILRPEDVKDKDLKDTLSQLVETRKPAELLANPVEFSLPPRKEPKRLGFISRTYNAIMLNVLPKRKATALEERLENEQKFRQAEARYAWLKEATRSFDNALATIKTSHDTITGYVQALTRGREQAQAVLDARTKALPQLEASLDGLTSHVSDPKYGSELAANLYGDDSVPNLENAKKPFQDARAEVTDEIARIRGENEYMRQVLEQAGHEIEAGVTSLAAISAAGKNMLLRKFSLARTVQAYEGLTLPQMQATRALQFLSEADRLEEELKDDMTEIHNTFNKQAQAYAARTPSDSPAPDNTYARLLGEQYASMEPGDHVVNNAKQRRNASLLKE
ncbi:hypothetical protein JW711_00490 [Candidatus Woesearchaeota archaeon]|nr:hypothetical protein [Candidatus Woesearchaeota archaeon]